MNLSDGKLQDRTRIALEFYYSGYNCAQSVFSAISSDYGMDCKQAMLVASCFGGGMRMGAACGAFTGALMALGLARGFSAYSPEAKAETEALTLQFIAMWEKQIGPVNCREILNVDVRDPQQRQNAKDNGVFEAHCPNCITTAIRLVSEFI